MLQVGFKEIQKQNEREGIVLHWELCKHCWFYGVNKWFQDESKDFTENSEYIKRKEKYNRFSPGHLQKYGTEYDSCAYNSWRTWNSTKDMKSKLDEL